MTKELLLYYPRRVYATYSAGDTFNFALLLCCSTNKISKEIKLKLVLWVLENFNTTYILHIYIYI